MAQELHAQWRTFDSAVALKATLHACWMYWRTAACSRSFIAHVRKTAPAQVSSTTEAEAAPARSTGHCLPRQGSTGVRPEGKEQQQHQQQELLESQSCANSLLYFVHQTFLGCSLQILTMLSCSDSELSGHSSLQSPVQLYMSSCFTCSSGECSS